MVWPCLSFGQAIAAWFAFDSVRIWRKAWFAMLSFSCHVIFLPIEPCLSRRYDSEQRKVFGSTLYDLATKQSLVWLCVAFKSNYTDSIDLTRHPHVVAIKFVFCSCRPTSRIVNIATSVNFSAKNPIIFSGILAYAPILRSPRMPSFLHSGQKIGKTGKHRTAFTDIDSTDCYKSLVSYSCRKIISFHLSR